MGMVCALKWIITFSTQPAKALPKLKMDVCGPCFVFSSNSLMTPRLLGKFCDLFYAAYSILTDDTSLAKRGTGALSNLYN